MNSNQTKGEATQKQYSEYYRYFQRQNTDDDGHWKWVEIDPRLYYELRRNPNYDKNDFTKSRRR